MTPTRNSRCHMVVHITAFLALCVAVFAALTLILIPKITGSQTYTVLTGSMAAGYPPGTFIVVKPAPFEDLRIGDVITFQAESGEPEVVTHRIVSMSAFSSGERTLVTKGDSNDVADAAVVREVQVRGRLLYAVPYVGHIANALGQSNRGLILQICAGALVAYGAVAMGHGYSQRRKPEALPRTGINHV